MLQHKAVVSQLQLPASRRFETPYAQRRDKPFRSEGRQAALPTPATLLVLLAVTLSRTRSCGVACTSVLLWFFVKPPALTRSLTLGPCAWPLSHTSVSLFGTWQQRSGEGA